MAAERDRDASLLGAREIVALADIVEAEQLDHHVMGGVLPGLDEGEAMVPLVDVHEIAAERAQPIIAEPEAEQLAVERHDPIDAVHVQHHMAHAERAGAETRNVAPGPDRPPPPFPLINTLPPCAS